MKKSIALISVFAILMIALSGCMGSNTPAANGTNSDNPKANVISDEDAVGMNKIKNLPIGFEYVGNLSLSTGDIKSNYKAENVSGILGGSEGFYKGYNNSDFYLDVIQFENTKAAKDFILMYQSSFTPLKGGSRFVEDPFNGHSAMRITDYVTDAGKSVPRYSYIWNNENYVLVVSGSTVDCSIVRQLAEATGY
jgi:predicted small secreted protein